MSPAIISHTGRDAHPFWGTPVPFELKYKLGTVDFPPGTQNLSAKQ